MIYFFTPYSFEKKLFEAYDKYMMLIPDPEDWGCLMDGDMAFLHSDFGNQLQEHIDAYPKTALFTCYGSRCPYDHQMAPGVNYESDSIRYIYDNTVNLRKTNHLKVLQLNQRIAGHLMLIQKKTWLTYRAAIAKHAVSANIQAVDTAISDVLLQNKEIILLMQGLQVFHYYRQYSFTEKHILSDKLTVVIRTHDRPQAFKTCIESVRKQTHKNIDIVVGVDTPGSYDYVLPYNVTRIVKCQPRKKISDTDFPANAYVSQLIADINNGYILILDDDNFINDPQGVEKLFNQIDKEYCLYIIRYRYADGRKFPNDSQFARKSIENGGIDWASHVFHARFKNISISQPLYNGDFYWINAIANYVKTQKWIDLDLVHTKTPGQNGKTETQPPKPKPIPFKTNPNGNIDVVYVVGSGSNWSDNELRFSIRSVEKNLAGFRNIVIVGNCPDFIQNVIHIPADDIFQPGINADGNIITKVLAACQNERVSEDFLFINDDHIVIKPIQITDVPPFHKGDMTDFPESFFKFNYWRSRLEATKKILLEKNMTCFNFDCHTPILMNKTAFKAVATEFDYATGVGLTMKSIYGNSVHPETGVFLQDEKRTVFQHYKLSQIKERLFPCTFMAFNNQGLNDSLMWWLIDNFPEQSCFETNQPKERIFDFYQWVKNGETYQEGLQLFKIYFKYHNMLRLFESKETETLRLKLNSKLHLYLKEL